MEMVNKSMYIMYVIIVQCIFVEFDILKSVQDFMTFLMFGIQ